MGDVDVEEGATTPEAVREHDAVNEKIGRTVYSSVAVLDGAVVAHTDIGVPREADEAHQWGTLVSPRPPRPPARRRGEGRQPAGARGAPARGAPGESPPTPRPTPGWSAINDRLGFRPVAVVPTLKRRL